MVPLTKKREDKKVYDLLRKGSGDMDTLQDNITMASFLRKHKDPAQEVKPGGKSVDDKYLDSVEQKALGLIKLFAEMAFYDDTERYNRFYASAAGRRRVSDGSRVQRGGSWYVRLPKYFRAADRSRNRYDGFRCAR